MPKLSDAEVVKAVNGELSRADSFMNARVSLERAVAYDYYYGREFGNEVDGRSRVVSADVAQAIDGAVPSILKVFVSGDKAVEFTPRGPEDVAAAEQATLGCNYVFFTQNNGYSLAHDFIKDGLLQKTGVFKWRWDTSVEMREKRFQGLDDATFQIVDQEPDAEIVEHSAYPDPMAQQAAMMAPPNVQVPAELPMLHDVTLRIKKEVGKIKIVVPPPEDVKISPDSMSLEVLEMPFIAHCPMLTESDLVEMGIEQSVIDQLPTGDNEDLYELERVARKDRLGDAASILDDQSGPNKCYRYNECYIRLDVDGDGIAELRKVCLVADTILHNEPVDHIPMCIWTPKVMPHEVIGISLADDVMDIQLSKSTLLRQAFDNLYLTNAPRTFVTGDVNMDDLLTVTPGGAIRGENGATLTPITIPFTAGASFPMLEYQDQEKSARIGFSSLGPGLDPGSINKTATFVREQTNQTAARGEIIARNAAEFGFKPLFKGIMYLLGKHQQKPLMARLSNKFVPIDPETWAKEYDMTCNVGIGMGSKDQQLMQLQALGMDLQAIGQSPFGSQLLDADKIFNYVQKKAELAGFKDVTPFLNDPAGKPPPPPPGPPPEIQKAQMEIQADQQKFQAQAQIDAQTAQQTQQAEAQKMQMEAAFQQAEMEQRAALEQYKIQKQMELEQFKVEKQAELERYKADLNAQVQREAAHLSAQSTVKAAYAGAKLDDPEDDAVKETKAQERMENQQLMQMLASVIAKASGPKEIVRGPDGKAIGVRPVG